MPTELSAVIHFLCLKHTRKQAILLELEKVYDKGVISLRAVENWTAGFDGARTELVDLSRSESPRDTGKVYLVPELIEGEGCLSQKKIADMLGIRRETVKRVSHDNLKMRKLNPLFQWTSSRS
jgi:hypothetical protein